MLNVRRAVTVLFSVKIQAVGTFAGRDAGAEMTRVAEVCTRLPYRARCCPEVFRQDAESSQQDARAAAFC